MGSTAYDFTDETVVVTGGSSGIGRAVARRFGAAGATVLVADVTADPRGGATTPTHEAIRDDGGNARFVETDVSDATQVESVVEAAREFGGVDVMVNNAGVYRGAPLVELDMETLDALYEVNVRGVVAGCRAAARDMLDRDATGSIVNTASVSSEFAQVGHTAYDATKGAILMATRVAALELARTGVRVNAVAPGAVETAIVGDGDETGGGTDRYDLPVVEKAIPMGRPADPAEVAGAYCFLASEDASYVTGHALYVDGGYRIR